MEIWEYISELQSHIQPSHTESLTQGPSLSDGCYISPWGHFYKRTLKKFWSSWTLQNQALLHYGKLEWKTKWINLNWAHHSHPWVRQNPTQMDQTSHCAPSTAWSMPTTDCLSRYDLDSEFDLDPYWTDTASLSLVHQADHPGVFTQYHRFRLKYDGKQFDTLSTLNLLPTLPDTPAHYEVPDNVATSMKNLITRSTRRCRRHRRARQRQKKTMRKLKRFTGQNKPIIPSSHYTDILLQY